MRQLPKYLGHAFAIVSLTMVTQIGGLVYLCCLVLAARLKKGGWFGFGLFLGLYLAACLAVAPLLAPLWGRVALPLSGTLRPLSLATCLLNRHYATPRLKAQMESAAQLMATNYPGTHTQYLDANFPFFDGFPLWPHLSHNDGRKLDLAFYYAYQGKPTRRTPSALGYGGSEGPKPGEVDYPGRCGQKGYWQYNLLARWMPQSKDNDLVLDEARTKALLLLLAKHPNTQKIFLEPHLRHRWVLARYPTIRYHGCQSVRHDDHIHLQVR